tara:strand:+ start:494 stop:721 length:228 start_codon:yes stop_codon:yes gene_type:complete
MTTMATKRELRKEYLTKLINLQIAFSEFTYVWENLCKEDILALTEVDWNGFNAPFEDIPSELSNSLLQVIEVFSK